jgi:beta-glucosidase
MGVAAIEGLQGDDFLIGRHHVMATAKHFAVHGQPEGGTNTAPGNYSERIIRENFLVPFQAAVEEARVGSVMASYNEIDGVPSHINHWLLDKVLRQEWGFKGYITSDGDGLQMLVNTHHVAYNNADAARQGIAAGIDYDLSEGTAYRTLVDQVKQGLVPESEVDRAVARAFWPPSSASDSSTIRTSIPMRQSAIVNSEEHRKLAVEAARKVIVLLKNDKNLLAARSGQAQEHRRHRPQRRGHHIWADTARDPGQGVSILDGIKARVGNKAKVLYAEGCKITTAPQGYLGWRRTM